MDDLSERLAHVLWIGGAPDAGKTTVAQALAAALRAPVYHYDRMDLRHHLRLAATSAPYAAFLDATMDERWVAPTPQDLAERSWRTFEDRFPFVVEDLTALTVPDGMPIFAEGFGWTPELLAPCVPKRDRAVFLFPTEAFKQESMARRRKGDFGGQVSDVAKAHGNLLERDRLLGARLRQSALDLGFAVIDVDGSDAVEEVVRRVADRLIRPTGV